MFSASLHRTPLRCPEIADPDPISASVCLRIERSDPSPIRVHPIADALRAVEPKRACRISVHPSIVAGGRACRDARAFVPTVRVRLQ